MKDNGCVQENMTGIRVAGIVIRGNKLMFMQQIVGEKLCNVFVGGGVYIGEKLEEAMLRELSEEANVTGDILFGPVVSRDHESDNTDYLFVINLSDEQNPSLGYDPEIPDGDEQVLKGITWRDANDDYEKFTNADKFFFRVLLDEAVKQHTDSDWVCVIKKILDKTI